jgi:TrmH family RNA methyltransferase
VRDLRALLRRPGRAEHCVVEGWRLLGAAVEAGVTLSMVVLTPAAARDHRWERLRSRLRSAVTRRVVVSDGVFAALTQVEWPQGVMGIAERPRDASPEILRDARTLCVVLDAIQDPGNVGTILRTAAAVAATAAVTAGPSADPLAPKALRASAGAAFHLPLLRFDTAADAAAALLSTGVRVLVADPRADRVSSEVSYARPLAVVLGNEGAGAHPAWQRAGAERVRVPIAGPVESLNVAAAAAVLLYRAAGLAP